MKILVADDELGIQKLFRAFLESKCSELRMVSNGKEAFNIMANERFDLIFMDKKIPGYDGVRVIQELNDLEIRPNIVLTSGDGDKGYADSEISSYKHVRFLPKPFMLEEVARIVDELKQL